MSHAPDRQVIPRREGSLAISGLSFQIGRSGVWGVRPLALPRKRLNETKAQKVTPTYEPDMSLSFRICGPMPLLEVRSRSSHIRQSPRSSLPRLPQVSLLGFPSSCFHGEVRRVTVELRNAGHIALQNVRLKLSHSAFFAFPTATAVSSFSSPSSSSPVSSPADALLTDILNVPFEYAPQALAHKPFSRVPIPFHPHFCLFFSPSIVSLPAVLQPGASQSLSVWLRADAVGMHQLFFLFYYESSIANKAMPYRLTKGIWPLPPLCPAPD